MDDILHFLVGNDLNVVGLHVEEFRHADSHLLDVSPEIADSHHIPDLDIPLHQQEDSGQDIPDQAVRSDTDDYGYDTGGGHQGGRIEAEADHAAVSQ